MVTIPKLMEVDNSPIGSSYYDTFISDIACYPDNGKSKFF